MVLNDLTKKQLLQLIVDKGYNCLITDRDMNLAIWRTLEDESQKTMDEAIKEMKEATGKNHQKWHAASMKFDKGIKIGEKASKVYSAL